MICPVVSMPAFESQRKEHALTLPSSVTVGGPNGSSIQCNNYEQPTNGMYASVPHVQEVTSPKHPG